MRKYSQTLKFKSFRNRLSSGLPTFPIWLLGNNWAEIWKKILSWQHLFLISYTKILPLLLISKVMHFKVMYLTFMLTFQYSVLISQLSERAKSIVRDLDPANELTYLRIKSRKHEILVAPEEDFILIVVQNPPEPLKGEWIKTWIPKWNHSFTYLLIGKRQQV